MTESERIESALDAVHWPNFVVDREWRLDLDSTGDKALWIWVIVSDTRQGDPESSTTWSQLRHEIRGALAAKSLEFWPYIRMKAQSDREAPSENS